MSNPEITTLSDAKRAALMQTMFLLRERKLDLTIERRILVEKRLRELDETDPDVRPLAQDQLSRNELVAKGKAKKVSESIAAAGAHAERLDSGVDKEGIDRRGNLRPSSLVPGKKTGEHISAIAAAGRFAERLDQPGVDGEGIDARPNLKPSRLVPNAAVREATRKAGKPSDGEISPAGSDLTARQMVAKAGSWDKVKETYLGSLETMQALLQFRTSEVDRIIQMVRNRMLAGNDSEEIKRKRGERIEKEEDKITKVIFELPDLMISAPGSTTPTSDYDIGFDHPLEKPWVGREAQRLFNEIFEGEWKKPSGTVFDTNVYTGDLPPDIAHIPSNQKKVLDNRIKNATKSISALGDSQERNELIALKARLEAEAKEVARVQREMYGEARSARDKKANMSLAERQAASVVDDMMAMLSKRRHMKDPQWEEYTGLLLSRLEGAASESTKKVLDDANKLYKELEAELHTKKQELGGGDGGEDDAAVQLMASNRLYEKYLEEASALVGQSSGVLKQAIASYFANEAYHTGAAVEGVVVRRQMGVPVEQTVDQHLVVFNENCGMVDHQHKAAFFAEEGVTNNGRFLWKSAKYFMRILEDLDEIMQKLDLTGSWDPAHASELKALAKQLKDIKEKEKSTEAEKDTEAEAAAAGKDVDKMVLALNVEVNAKVRTLKAAAPTSR